MSESYTRGPELLQACALVRFPFLKQPKQRQAGEELPHHMQEDMLPSSAFPKWVPRDCLTAPPCATYAEFARQGFADDYEVPLCSPLARRCGCCRLLSRHSLSGAPAITALATHAALAPRNAAAVWTPAVRGRRHAASWPLSMTSEPGRSGSCLECRRARITDSTRPDAQASWPCLASLIRRRAAWGEGESIEAETC
jgi:hypothetical protein